MLRKYVHIYNKSKVNIKYLSIYTFLDIGRLQTKYNM